MPPANIGPSEPSKRKSHSAWFVFGLVCLTAGSTAVDAATPSSSEPIRFNRDIRPILSENCFQCHGPDKDKRKAKLRLDTKDGLFGEIGGHTIVTPADSARSAIFQRITAHDKDDLMPPIKSGKTLSAAQVELIRRWIETGAKWEGHWAYQPPVRWAVPALKQSHGSNAPSPLDAFVLARLEREGLSPAAEADRRTLLRRLSFDLTGLPPTPKEVRAFETDRSPRAYEREVDRLLASPHFGERLAIYWLDLVRYADTDGYHADNFRNVYPYRDYVIRSFNENKWFDQFTVEQVAGDLLPNATLEQRVASTFNRLGRSTEEGGAQAKEYLAKYAADRVRTVSMVWLGSTMGCCECHDHKYDPYTTKDFYRLAAYFADVKEQGVGKPEESLVLTEAQESKIAGMDAQIKALETRLTAVTPELAAAQTEWQDRLRAELQGGRLEWERLKPTSAISSGGATLTNLDDLSVLATGENPDNDTYTVTLTTGRRHITGIRLEALTDPSHDKKSLARGGGGNFVLTEFEVETGEGTETEKVPISSAIADYSQGDFPVANAIDGRADTGWAVSGQDKMENRQAAFIFRRPLAGGENTRLTVRLKHDSQYKHHNIGRFRLSLISVDRPTLDESGLPANVKAALAKDAGERTGADIGILRDHFLSIAPALDATRAQLAQHRREKEDFVRPLPRTMMTVRTDPRVVRVLPRGNWMNDSGEVVTPAPPQFLQPTAPPATDASRLQLAKWLVSRDNPLTARVMVNRLWKLYSGVGICKNLDDFGAQAEWPTNPELLDWLAVEFMDSGWDIKHMIRLMVTSRTYRQNSLSSPQLKEKDPYNRLYARQSRFRLSAEMVRDNALAISGLLSPTIGGPSVKPYQPAGYWDQLNFPKRTWDKDSGEALYRRGLYTFWCRSFLQPSLLAFDACSREESSAERMPSNTPLQALALLNDTTYVEAARVLAARALNQPAKAFGDRLEWVFEQALQRRPSTAEARLLKELYQFELARYRADKPSAEKLNSVGEYAKPANLDQPQLAVWSSVTRAILNVHECISRY